MNSIPPVITPPDKIFPYTVLHISTREMFAGNFLDVADSYECTQTQVDAPMEIEFPVAAPPRIETNILPWARLVSLSPGVQDIELIRNNDNEGGLWYKQTFGRSRKNCDWVFDDARISSVHCYMYCQKLAVGEVVSQIGCIVDESANGTYVNGKRLKRHVRHVLYSGDEISLIKPESGAASSDSWSKARFIIKFNFVGPTGETKSRSRSIDGENASSGQRRPRVASFSRLLRQDRNINDYYQMIRSIGEGANGQVR